MADNPITDVRLHLDKLSSIISIDYIQGGAHCSSVLGTTEDTELANLIELANRRLALAAHVQPLVDALRKNDELIKLIGNLNYIVSNKDGKSIGSYDAENGTETDYNGEALCIHEDNTQTLAAARKDLEVKP